METPAPTVFLFNTPSEAEDTLFALSRSGIDVTQLSLIGKGSVVEDRPLGFYTKERNIKACGGIGAFWGTIWGMLFAPAVLQLPGMGLVAMAGPIVSQLANVLEGTIVSHDQSPLAAALTLVGLQRSQIPRLQMAVTAGKYLLIVAGASRDLLKVRAALRALRVPSVV
jgi:hypothetical protein